MENIKKGYSISRRMASKLLGVSTRTVDRYVKDSKLSTVTIAGRIWLNKGEINDIRFKSSHGISGGVASMSTSDMSIDKRVDSVDSVHIVDRQGLAKQEKKSITVQQRLDMQEENIELLTQKIEGVKEELSNLGLAKEHNQDLLKLQIENENFQKQLEKIDKKYKKTFILKYIFLIGFLIILALQPLWLLIHLNKFF
jgi:predicted site-specific integrase-resolvase